MLSPDYLRKITELTEQKVDEVNTYLTAKIVQRIVTLFQETGEVKIIPSSLLDLKKQQNAGKLLEEIQAEIERQLPSIKNEVRRAFYDAGAKIANDVNATTGEILRAEQERGNLSEVEIPQFENRNSASKVSELNLTDKEISCLESAFRRTDGEIYNLTRTAPMQAQRAYIEACDKAYFKATHGTSLDTAIVDAINEVSKKGVTVVHYASGHEDRIEVAIARAVRTGVNQANGDITLTRCAESGVGYVLTSSHIGARVTPYLDYRTHAEWQGKVYSLDWNNPLLAKYQPRIEEQPKGKFSFLNKMKEYFQERKNRKYKDFIEACGYGKMLGICGINCRHSFGMFYPGISINNQIQYNSEENSKRYKLEQRQRAMERAIREVRRELDALNNSGLTSAEVKDRKGALTQLLHKRDAAYRAYCKENGLKPLNYRLQVAKTYGVKNVTSLSENMAKSVGGRNKVYFDEKKDYRIELDGYSQRVNDGLSRAAHEVAKLGSETMWEHCKLVNLKTGEIEFATTDHEFAQVGGFYKYVMRNSGSEYAFIHNHNTETKLSLPDMQILAGDDNIKVVAAVRNDGIISLVENNGITTSEYLFTYYENQIKKFVDENKAQYGADMNEKMEEYAVELAAKEFGKGMVIYGD